MKDWEDLSRDEKVRLTALDRAINAGTGTEYNDNSFAVVNADKIIEAARKFENYMKGSSDVSRN